MEKICIYIDDDELCLRDIRRGEDIDWHELTGLTIEAIEYDDEGDPVLTLNKLRRE